MEFTRERWEIQREAHMEPSDPVAIQLKIVDVITAKDPEVKLLDGNHEELAWYADHRSIDPVYGLYDAPKDELAPLSQTLLEFSGYKFDGDLSHFSPADQLRTRLAFWFEYLARYKESRDQTDKIAVKALIRRVKEVADQLAQVS